MSEHVANSANCARQSKNICVAYQWLDDGGMLWTRCGAHKQGDLLVWRDAHGWRWRLDMLPLDEEPLVVSISPYRSAAAARRDAEMQARRWPALIRNARRA